MKTEQQLPKNIRQIGSPAGHTKVYIEDYVITFLNSLSMDKNTYVRGAILFGEKKQIGNDLVIFIRGAIEGQKVLLVKPQTYMNLSGESIRSLVEYYKIDPEEELLVIYDDISLEVGQLRIRRKGSAGGHNGIKNIIAMTGTQNFMRIKVGVGEKPKGWDLADYVLGRFSTEDRAKVEEAIGHAMDAAVLMMQGEVDKAMNDYNSKNK